MNELIALFNFSISVIIFGILIALSEFVRRSKYE
jgi:hypothetical protein